MIYFFVQDESYEFSKQITGLQGAVNEIGNLIKNKKQIDKQLLVMQ